MPLSVLSKPWALQPSRMELGAGPSCQGYTDSERCTVTPDGCLTRACPWSQGELARVIQHKLISSSQSLLAPCQGQELGPLMANISSSLLQFRFQNANANIAAHTHGLLLPEKDFTGSNDGPIIPRRLTVYSCCLD